MKKHGHARSGDKPASRTYTIYYAMRYRCNNPKHPHYWRYGGRGITYCKDWESFDGFLEWVRTQLNGEEIIPKHLSLDRIDNDGNYEPVNCRLATDSQQHNNKRNNR